MNEELRQLHLLGATGASRTVMEGDREWLVIPTVALMEGVIRPVNAKTAEFVSASVLEKAAPSWNGKPVTLGHPVKNGTQCSANSDDIKATHHIGEIRNSRYADKKLLQEMWVDTAKTEKLQPKLLADLRADKAQSVSVGAFVHTDDKAGDFGGKPYKASWLETSGDHLAVLYGGRGACSQEMGCSTHRAAMHFIAAEGIELEDAPLIEACEAYLVMAKAKYAECETCGGTGQVKDGDKQQDCPTCDGEGMRAAEGRRNSDADAQIIQSVHDHAMALGATCDRKNWKTLGAPDGHPFYGNQHTGGGGGEALKADEKVDPGTLVTYAIPGDGEKDLTFTVVEDRDDRVLIESRDFPGARIKPTEVVAKTELKRLEAAITPQLKAACRCEEESTMTKEQKAVLIAALTTDKHSGFTEGDVAFLEAAADARLEAFKAAAEANKTAADLAAKNENDLRAAQAKITVIEGKLKAAEAAPTEEEWLTRAPAGIKTLLEHQKAQETELREELVKQLKVAGANTEEELKAMPTAQLQTLAKYAKVQAPDFSGRGMPVHRAAQDDGEDYTPPDPYEADIKALQSTKVN